MDEPCEICGLNEGQDHTTCFEVKDLTRQLAEAQEEIADIRDTENRLSVKLAEALAEIERLREWKKEALEMESMWDCQAVGNLLVVRLGERIRPKIQPGIEDLKNEIARLRKALEAIKNAYEHRPMVDSNDLYTIAKAALEASDG